MSSSPTISYRLRPVAPPSAPADLTDEQRRVTGNTAGRLKVLAGPGTGKTTTLVEAVAERVQVRGVPAEQILVLTFSRRAAGELSGRIARRLGLTTRESMVRTLHSYAYSVLRTQARGAGEPTPRLLAADESDQMVRELLAGHRSDGGGGWPDHLGQALGSPTFAAELREILLRAAGQGITPQRMFELGRRHKRPEWTAVGSFAREYQQVSDLRQGVSGFGVALDQAELTAAALGALRRDDLLAAEQRRVRRIFVDEYQDVDPAQARLVSVLAAGADELVVFGDPDQSIYAFRGAEPTALRDVAVDATVALTVSRRLPPAVLTATRRTAAQLPGPTDHRNLGSAGDHPAGEVMVRVFPSAAREAAAVADALRRAHLLDGIAWKSMAVLLRSPAAGLSTLARACAVAGVPVLLGGGNEVLSTEPLVAALLTVLECGVDPSGLTGQVALDLMASPIGEMDALALRRVRRSLRAARPEEGSSADLLAAVLNGAPPPPAVAADLLAPVLRVRDLLAIARTDAGNPVAEQVLWRLWQAARLEPALVAAVERGGTGGQRADRALDCVLGLFSMAADLAQRVPLAGVRAFLDQVRGHQLPGTSDTRHVGEAVAVLSAHAAKGLEWELVVVMGAQEGIWPDLRQRGSLLRGPELFDLAAGLPVRAPAGNQVAQERRLFYVACTRARRTLLCTAVSNQDFVPSRFLPELAGTIDELPVEQDAMTSAGRSADRRGLHLTDLLADLRRAVTDPDTPPRDARRAAVHLAELAAEGVHGARTQDWYGLAPRSSHAPPIAPGAQIRVSPSLIESLDTCALRAVLERRGGRTEPGQAQLEGIVVHAMAHGLAQGVAEADLHDEIETFLSGQHHLPPWQLARTRRGLLSMLGAAAAWVRDQHPPRTVVGSELEMDVLLPPDDPADPGAEVRLVGRVDWLSKKPDGTLVVTDFKTGASVPTVAQARANPQLAAYQAAISLGAFREPADTAPGGAVAERVGQRPGGAELVYLRSGKPKVLQQEPQSESASAEWLGSIRSAAAHLASATAWATENPRCERCPVRSSCPLQNEGRQVTR